MILYIIVLTINLNSCFRFDIKVESLRTIYPQQGTILVNEALRAALDGDAIAANEAIYSYHKWMDRRQEAAHRQEWISSHEDYVKLEQAIAALSLHHCSGESELARAISAAGIRRIGGHHLSIPPSI